MAYSDWPSQNGWATGEGIYGGFSILAAGSDTLPFAPGIETAYPESQTLSYSYATNATSFGANIQAAWTYANGLGITVAVVDDGFTASTIDNFSARSADFSGSGTLAEPSGGFHGTTTSSLIGGAPLDGMTGLAPDAGILGVKVAFGDTPLAEFTAALTYAAPLADVINNSWGFSSFAVGEPNDPSFAGWYAALELAVAEGRNGLGTVVVFAAGNARADGADLGLLPFTADPRAIAVAASTLAGTVASFSTPGAGLWVAAMGQNLLLDSPNGLAMDSGTSYSAPIISAIVALMLQVNPELGWRDVQEILADAAYQPAPSEAGFTVNAASGWNGGGMFFSNDLGFGVVDAAVAVNLARSWTIRSDSANLDLQSAQSTAAPVAIGAAGGGAMALVVADAERIEHVQVTLQDSNLLSAYTTLTLVSPAGTQAVIASRMGLVAGADKTGGLDLNGDQIDVNAFLGENAQGNWTLLATNANGATATLTGWSLAIWGDSGTGAEPLVYTPEFASLAASDPSRTVISNAATGTTAIDIIGTPGANDINLAGGTGMIDGVAVSVRPGLNTLSFAGDTGSSIAYAAPSGSTILGGDAYTCVIGGGGADNVTAGLGATLVLQNRDTSMSFIGGAGGSCVVGSGTGRLNFTAGAGTDDLVLVNGTEGGIDILKNFALGQDQILLSGYGAGIVSQAIAAQRSDYAGGTIITLPDNTRIDLVGVPYVNTSLFGMATGTLI